MPKHYIALALTLVLFGLEAAHAQLRKASDYYPLKTGNIWQYFGNEGVIDLGVIDLLMTSDTLLGDSFRLYRTGSTRDIYGEVDGVALFYYYYNSDSTVLYRAFDVPTEVGSGVPLLDTRVPLRSKWTYSCDSLQRAFAIVDSGTMEFFDGNDHYVDVYEVDANSNSLVFLDRSFRFADGLGLVEINLGGSVTTCNFAIINGIEYGTPVSVVNESEAPAAVPRTLSLHIHPNPVSSHATISITSAEREPVEIRIVDILGRTVRRFTLPGAAETVRIAWDGRDETGRIVSNGVYLLTAQAGNSLSAHKILYIR